MKRKIYKELLAWKNSPYRKPLILQGARQVGKSWILKEFGCNEYEYTAYLSCDNEPFAEALFADYDIDRIVRSIEAITNVPVKEGKTLIILDEIQAVPRGLTALKYFCENRPGFHVAVAGSLLGITLHSGTSFPVGKVDFLEMHPMDFEEFLWAKGDNALSNLIRERSVEALATVNERCVEMLRQYYFVGGMPEAVGMYCQNGSVIEVRKIQKAIVEAYRNVISKLEPIKEVERVQLVLRSLPAQLARENKKFVYSAVRSGARAAEFEIAIQWLVDAGIVTKVSRVAAAKSLKLFVEQNNLPFGVRLSMLPYIKQERLVNIPLYAAASLKAWLYE